jgi:alkyl hydroperoxide reductase subunit AhpF
MKDSSTSNPFDAETWALLPDYFEKLPKAVQIHVWGAADAGQGEQEAQRLAQTLADRFSQIGAAFFPRRANYPYYPVIGIFGLDDEEAVDYGVRLIGLPSGYQMTSLITAIQAVSFQGASLEAATRIRLQGLDHEIRLEVLTSAEDEAGVVMAKTAFGLAVASPHIRSFLIMTDVFPMAAVRYSATYLPHMVINSRVHIDGVMEEEEVLKQIAKAVESGDQVVRESGGQ